VTLKADGTRPDLQSVLRISASVFDGRVEAGWAVLEESSDPAFSGWTVHGPGEYSEDRMPSVDGDEYVEQTFEQVGGVLPDILDLLDWGNGEFPLLMQSWTHNGIRKWMPWEDFSKYAALGGHDD
jgi:hypothetical protein